MYRFCNFAYATLRQSPAPEFRLGFSPQYRKNIPESLLRHSEPALQEACVWKRETTCRGVTGVLRTQIVIVAFSVGCTRGERRGSAELAIRTNKPHYREVDTRPLVLGPTRCRDITRGIRSDGDRFIALKLAIERTVNYASPQLRARGSGEFHHGKVRPFETF